MSKAKRPQDYSFSSLKINIPMVKEAKYSKANTPALVSKLCEEMAGFAQEAFVILTLNAKNNVIDKHLITLGLVDASLVHPREIFRRAILDNCNSVILVHNHPSSELSPSAEDIRITRQMIDAGKIIDIHILDHVIVGGSGFFSMRESGIVQF
jgi:DNA repair protein RadC